VAALVLLALFLYLQFRPGHYPARDKYPVRGLDISRHQGQIDWDDLGQEKLAFVYIKATEGIDLRDRMFNSNWAGAKRAGLARGAYHFFTFCMPGRNQAENFIAVVPKIAGTLPPAVDVEMAGNCKQDQPSDEIIRSELGVFLQRIEEAYHRKPIIYATEQSYSALISGNFQGYRAWIRDLTTVPVLDDVRIWSFWQCADRGELRGVSGMVDLDVFCCGFRDFAKLLSE